jgi:hypothetical protein
MMRSGGAPRAAIAGDEGRTHARLEAGAPSRKHERKQRERREPGAEDADRREDAEVAQVRDRAREKREEPQRRGQRGHCRRRADVARDLEDDVGETIAIAAELVEADEKVHDVRDADHEDQDGEGRDDGGHGTARPAHEPEDPDAGEDDGRESQGNGDALAKDPERARATEA